MSGPFPGGRDSLGAANVRRMSAKVPLMPEQKIPLYMLDRPLTSADLFTYCNELAALQGNILKSHGREATVSVFGKDEGMAWIDHLDPQMTPEPWTPHRARTVTQRTVFAVCDLNRPPRIRTWRAATEREPDDRCTR